MFNKDINIIIFIKSDIILKGLFNIVNETGFEAILIKNIEDLIDYPKILGPVIIITNYNFILGKVSMMSVI